MLRRRHERVTAVAAHPREDVEPLLIVGEQLHVDVDVIAGVALVDVADVALDREVAAARREVVGVDADERAGTGRRPRSTAAGSGCR